MISETYIGKKNPLPVTFGENVINTIRVLLPFAPVLLVLRPATGLIISKLGTMTLNASDSSWEQLVLIRDVDIIINLPWIFTTRNRI
jgi:hypothetical protein